MRHILEDREIAHYFTAVYGAPEKKEIYINNITKYKFRLNELIFFGDSQSDQ